MPITERRMEKKPAYHEFDELLRDIAELWLEMVEEFMSVYIKDEINPPFHIHT